MATDKGVIQGYTGVAAQAHGTGSEQALLLPVVKELTPLLAPTSLITADAGYHSKGNLVALDAMNVEALMADNQMRQRDSRFNSQARHKTKPAPRHNKTAKPIKPSRYKPSDFTYDRHAGTCMCPAGKTLYHHGSHCLISGREGS